MCDAVGRRGPRCSGHHYAVLPGGHVEEGESAETAALRELREETTLEGRIDRLLWTGRHNRRPASYFLVTDVTGTPVLSGMEADKHGPDNSFQLMWATADEFDRLNLHPSDIREPLAALLRHNHGVGDRIEIVDYDPEWPALFGALGRTLREALGDVAVRIDHIGSTSVPGLAAKPVIDVQVSVRSFEPLDAFMTPLEGTGLVHRADNPERTKRYFREAPGSRRTHVHVRELGSFSQQVPLLFRDYLRAHPAAAAEFASVKRRCAAEFHDERQKYVAAKEPYVWDILRQADTWAQGVGWRPGPSDA